MDFGAHLPIMDFGGNPYTLGHLSDYATRAADLGFETLAVNDHMVFSVPWLDGLTALAAVLGETGTMTLATTVSLPVVRGAVPAAKALAAIDRLSGGRLVVGVGPGSSPRDYEAVGIPFDERWARLDRSIAALRALWSPDGWSLDDERGSTDTIRLEPLPARRGGPPIWVGSWGSDAGLRRTARSADGWIASAYNTTPAAFGEAWERLGHLLAEHGRDPAAFPNAVATMWFYITEDRAEADRVMRERVLPAVNRPADILRQRIPVGSAERFAELLTAFARAGAQRVHVWPVADEVRQLERFWDTVRPAVEA